MSKVGKQTRTVLAQPKKVAGLRLKHRIPRLMPLEKIARRNRNQAKGISRANHRKRRPHGR